MFNGCSQGCVCCTLYGTSHIRLKSFIPSFHNHLGCDIRDIIHKGLLTASHSYPPPPLLLSSSPSLLLSSSPSPPPPLLLSSPPPLLLSSPPPLLLSSSPSPPPSPLNGVWRLLYVNEHWRFLPRQYFNETVLRHLVLLPATAVKEWLLGTLWHVTQPCSTRLSLLVDRKAGRNLMDNLQWAWIWCKWQMNKGLQWGRLMCCKEG